MCIIISSLTPKLIQSNKFIFSGGEEVSTWLVATVQTRWLGCQLAIVGRELGHKLVLDGLFLWSYLDYVGISLYIVCCFVSSNSHDVLNIW